MMRKFAYIFGLSVLVAVSALFSGSCKDSGPSTPYDIAFTPTPVRIYGSVNVFVEDKGIGVPNLTVQAIPPSGVTVFSQATTASGIAIFNPPYLEVGNWTFVVPAQTPFPFAPSTITMPVSAVGETANFNSAGATLYLTPTVPESFTSTTPGSPYTYNMVYSQPGNLFVPAQMAFSAFPNNWSGTYGPATIGYGNADTASVTVIGVNCVDQQPSFAVTALDFEPTPYPRANSSPQTILKGFTSTVTVTWNTTGINSNFCGNGTFIGIVSGTLTVSTSNACSSDAVVSVSMNAGNCCFSQFQTPNGTVSGSNCGGGSVNFGPGSYNCTIESGATYGVLNCSFNGVSKSVNVPTSGSVQLLSTTY
jgi:hypothetical protein